MATKTANKRKKPPIYPHFYQVKVSEVLRSQDLWWAVYFFVLLQTGLFLLMMAGTTENSLPFIIGGVAVGMWTVSHALMVSNKRQVKKLRYDGIHKGRVIGVVLGLFVFIYAMSFVLLAFGIRPMVQPNQETVNVIMNQQFWPMAFMTIVVAPVTEELVFRELLPYAGGKSRMSFIIASLMFTLLHAPVGLTGWLLYGGISFAFMYLRLKGNNIQQAMVGHVAYNLISTLLSVL